MAPSRKRPHNPDHMPILTIRVDHETKEALERQFAFKNAVGEAASLSDMLRQILIAWLKKQK